MCFLISGCMMGSGEPYPPGAKAHGPYLDRTYQDFFVRAVHVEDVTVISVQQGTEPAEPAPEFYVEARARLAGGSFLDRLTTTKAASGAAAFEAAAKKAAEVPGWCPFGTRFAFLPPLKDPPGYGFTIRGDFDPDIGGFVFAGQCT